MKTILVTGAGGFIGRHLAARLRQSDAARVLALGRSLRNERSEDVLAVELEHLTASFWRSNRVDSIDVVFHFGAYMPKNYAEANVAGPIIASNIQGTAALLESLPSVPGHVVFASTVDVYKRRQGCILDEQSGLGPTTLYGASKLFAEQLVRSYAARTRCRYSILRLGHIFGPGEERFEKVIPNLIRAMIRGDVPQLSGNGSTLRDLLYVEDAVEAVVTASKRNGSADPLNIVRGESIAIVDAARLIAEIVGYAGPFHFSGENGESLRFNGARMKEVLRIERFTPIEEGLAREVASFRRQMVR